MHKVQVQPTKLTESERTVEVQVFLSCLQFAGSPSPREQVGVGQVVGVGGTVVSLLHVTLRKPLG